MAFCEVGGFVLYVEPCSSSASVVICRTKAIAHRRELKTVLEAKRASTLNRGNRSKFVQESTDLMGLQTSLSRTAIQKALEIW